MNELRSTEILDKEIHADAVRKVERILQKAENECQEILSSVEENIKKAALEKDNFYSRKITAFEKDQTAAIPLEKERFEVSFIQSAVCKNINEYLNTLGEEKRLSLVLNQISLDSDTFKDKKINAFVYGFTLETVKKALSAKLGKNLAKCEKTEFGKISIEEEIVTKPEGIILESEDKTFRIRLTLSEVVSNLLDKNREALCQALFGKNISGSNGGAA